MHSSQLQKGRRWPRRLRGEDLADDGHVPGDEKTACGSGASWDEGKSQLPGWTLNQGPTTARCSQANPSGLPMSTHALSNMRHRLRAPSSLRPRLPSQQTADLMDNRDSFLTLWRWEVQGQVQVGSLLQSWQLPALSSPSGEARALWGGGVSFSGHQWD